MLIREGQDRSGSIDLRLAVWLALAAGAVNAAGFRSLGHFSANMTGNVSTMSDMLALGRVATAMGFLALLVAFVCGALFCGLIVRAGARQGIGGIYALAILIEAALLVPLAMVDLVASGAGSGWTLVIGLSFLMGLQNATTTGISEARVRTSHVSGIATDIGLELAELVIRDPRRPDPRPRLVLHGATLLAFFGGGVAGVWGYERIGAVVFLVVSVGLAWLALATLQRLRRTT
ncbi:DUF1275 domain-containing protein [Mesobaculum littorinae]|uniref:DUF1275 domain-containing protein n=1 Tax=Mesobaculum littorinae TaxID=2486419 RepID=A0A438AF35_9RHOB|nr:YoaK family protein [Mesobaculum littorinae]RVV97299.1 DUF1275 domain-containing protein [Mesobaculum littorinae]